MRCVTLPQGSGADGDPELALLRDGRAPRPRTAARARRGARAAPFWAGAGGRLKSGAHPPAARAAEGARAGSRTPVRARQRRRRQGDCRDIDAANLPDQTRILRRLLRDHQRRPATSSMNVSASSGYRDRRAASAVRLDCSNLELPECPRPDGTLEGTDGHSSTIGFRVTKDGALVQSFRTVVRSTQKLRGEVAADAKLDRVTLEDTANESTTVADPRTRQSAADRDPAHRDAPDAQRRDHRRTAFASASRSAAATPSPTASRPRVGRPTRTRRASRT